jgi:type IV secretory pathway TrbF-like protein
MAAVSAFDPKQDQYRVARAEYSDRYAELGRGKRNWQIAALAFAVLAAMFGVIAIIQVRQVKMIPYLVLEDRLANVISVPLPLRPAATALDELEKQTRAAVTQSIIGLRSVYGDPVAQWDVATEAKSRLMGQADNYVGEWMHTHNPYAIARDHTVEAVRNSIQLLPNPRHRPGFSYQFRWTERYFDLHGRPTHEPDTHWVALLHAHSEAVSDEPLLNPNAVKIDWLTWGPEDISGGQK